MGQREITLCRTYKKERVCWKIAPSALYCERHAVAMLIVGWPAYESTAVSASAWRSVVCKWSWSRTERLVRWQNRRSHQQFAIGCVHLDGFKSHRVWLGKMSQKHRVGRWKTGVGTVIRRPSWGLRRVITVLSAKPRCANSLWEKRRYVKADAYGLLSPSLKIHFGH
jgi:hypothetical protein